MFNEIKNVRQEPGAGKRRWFESDGLDLVIWQDETGKLSGFQICYDLGRGEHALTWRPGGGFAHSAVDSGDHTPFKNETPILTADGAVPWAEVMKRFDERSAGLDEALRQQVGAALTARK